MIIEKILLNYLDQIILDEILMKKIHKKFNTQLVFNFESTNFKNCLNKLKMSKTIYETS